MSGHHNKNNSGSLSRRVAMGGVFSALAVVLMILSAYLPITTFAMPAFAGLCLVPICTEFGTKYAIIAFLGISILSFLFVFPTNPEPAFFFLLLLGYYPIIQLYLNKIRSQALQYLLKLLLFNVALVAIYSILLFLIASPALVEELLEATGWFLGLLVFMGNITFIVYDILLDKVRIIYMYRFRRYFFKK